MANPLKDLLDRLNSPEAQQEYQDLLVNVGGSPSRQAEVQQRRLQDQKIAQSWKAIRSIPGLGEALQVLSMPKADLTTQGGAQGASDTLERLAASTPQLAGAPVDLQGATERLSQRQSQAQQLMQTLQQFGIKAGPEGVTAAPTVMSPLDEYYRAQLHQLTTRGQPPSSVVSPQPSQTTPGSVNEYVQQQAQKRTQAASPPVQLSMSSRGGKAVGTLRPVTPKPVPEKQVEELLGLEQSTQRLESLLTQADQFAQQLGPANLSLKRNAVSNLYRQYKSPAEVDAFLRDYQQAELEYRKSVEGLRLIMGGQSIAQAAYPDPRNQRHAQFRQTGIDFIANAAVQHERILQRLHELGYDVSQVQPYQSPYLENAPISKYVAGTRASAKSSNTLSTDEESLLNTLQRKP